MARTPTKRGDSHTFQPIAAHGPTMAWIAEAFAGRHSDVLCFVPGDGWRLCVKGVWEAEQANRFDLTTLVNDFIGEVLSYSSGLSASDRATLVKLCLGVLNRPTSNFLRFAQDYLSASADGFNVDPTALPCQSGLIDLRSGKVATLKAADRVTRCVQYPLDKKAASPQFDKLLRELFEDDKAVISYVQKVMGYCLTGLNSEQKFFVFFGVPQTGKSTLLRLLDGVLSNGLVQEIPFHTFVSTSDHDKLSPRHGELMKRANRGRVAWAAEGKEHQPLDGPIMKSWTGQEKQSVKGLFEKEHSVTVQAKIILCTNHPPIYDDASGGVDRRMVVIPFNHKVKDCDKDPALVEKIIAQEGAGVFRWFVEGARRWFAEGLGSPPTTIAQASTAVKENNNSVLAFVSDRLQTGGRVQASTALDAYKEFCSSIGVRPESDKKFSTYFPQQCANHLQSNAPQKLRSASGFFWSGVSLRSNSQTITKDLADEFINGTEIDFDKAEETVQPQGTGEWADDDERWLH